MSFPSLLRNQRRASSHLTEGPNAPLSAGICVASAALALATIACTLKAAPPERQLPFPVSVEWLAQHVNDPGLVLIHVGDKAEYDTEHLPAAQFLQRQEISTPGGSFPILEMPPMTQLQQAFESLGVGDDSTVVVYFGKDWVTPAARVVLTLDYMGLGDRATMLDGGLPAWSTAGHETTSEVTPAKPGRLTPRRRDDIIVDLAWIRAHLARPDVALVDARTPNFYRGESAGSAARAGHLPGASNIPFSSVVDDSLKFKDRSMLEKLLRDAGVGKDRMDVTYCHIGQQASLVYLVARMLGYDARMYDGSFTEWASKPDLTVEKPQ